MNVIRLDEQPTEAIVAHDGEGLIDFVRLSDRLDMKGAWEFVDFARVPPGASVGPHEHGADEELYVVLRGRGIVSVDGVEEPIEARCILVNPPHATHGIRTSGDEALEFVVLKVPLQESGRA